MVEAAVLAVATTAETVATAGIGLVATAAERERVAASQAAMVIARVGRVHIPAVATGARAEPCAQ